MRIATTLRAVACASLLLVGCSDDGSSASTGAIEQAWATSVGEVALELNKETRLEGGTCRAGTVAGLAVEICTFNDAVSADSAREKGLAQVGSNTGVALVRDEMLLVASDPKKLDVHGKKLNRLSKIFLDSGAAASTKTFGM